MKKKILLTTGVLTVFGYIVFAIFTSCNKSNDRICKKVEIMIKDSEHLRFINEEDISRFLDEKKLNPKGVNMQSVDIENIEKTLKKHSCIKSAECYKTHSGTLYIEIKQREPVLRIMNNGKDFYIDKDRKMMDISTNFTAYVPVATGSVDTTLAKGDLYKFAMFLKENDFWNAQIEQIHVNSKKEIELIPRVGDHVILLGTFDDYEAKLNKLLSMYKTGFRNTGWNCYGKINLKYDNQVVCTKK